MEEQLSKGSVDEGKIKAIAQKNIEKFLKELDEKASRESYINDPFEDEYDKKIYDGDVIKILDDYEKRRDNVTNQWEELKEKASIEVKNGYIKLSKDEKYKICTKRRNEAEKILREANLGSKDTLNLREGKKENGLIGLIDIIVEIYEIYGLHKLDKEDIFAECEEPT